MKIENSFLVNTVGKTFYNGTQAIKKRTPQSIKTIASVPSNAANFAVGNIAAAVFAAVGYGIVCGAKIAQAAFKVMGNKKLAGKFEAVACKESRKNLNLAISEIYYHSGAARSKENLVNSTKKIFGKNKINHKSPEDPILFI